MKQQLFCAALVSFVLIKHTNAQIPVELFAGNKKASNDLMFFKFFKNTQNENSKWLFFSRARCTVDYKMTTTTNLPSFGLTDAISYNHPGWKGFSPVAVVQVFNRGIFPKAGIQYVQSKKELTVFTWLVCETLKQPNLDYFILLRFTPKLNDKLNLYTQLETVNTMPTNTAASFNFTQRLRLGLMINNFQIGAGADLSQTGRTSFMSTNNVGGFVRCEFR